MSQLTSIRHRARLSCAAAAAMASVVGVSSSFTASAVEWDGSAGFSWSLADNWTPADVPDSAVEVADFTGVMPGAILLDGDKTVGALNFTVAGGYTITGGTPATSTLTISNGTGGGTLTQNSTLTNTIAARLVGAGITANVSQGTLALTNTAAGGSANSVDAASTFTVGAGATLSASFGSTPVINGGSNSLGSAAVTLSGGTLNLDGLLATGGLTARVFQGSLHGNVPTASGPNGAADILTVTRANGRYNTLNSAPLAGSANAVLGANRQTTGIDPDGSGAMPPGPAYAGFDYGNVPATGPDVVGVGLSGSGPDSNTYQALGYQGGVFSAQSSFTGRFVGKINITTGGDYTFTTRSDDGSVLFIDGQLVVDNNSNHAMIDASGTINLSPGLHDIQVIQWEASGGSGLVAAYRGPDTVALGAPAATNVVIPASVLSGGQGRYTLGNNLSLTASSTINVNNADQAVMGTLSMSPGVTLTKGGVGALRFTGATTLGGTGTTTYTVNTSGNDVIFGNLVSAAGNAITIAKSGNGNLILDISTVAPSLGTGSTLAFDVQAGRLMAISETGAANFNVLGANSLVRLNGAGTALQLVSRTGNVTFDNPIEVSQNAALELNSDNNNGLTMTVGSATNRTFVGDGATLTVDVYSNITGLFNPSATASTGGLTKYGPGTLRIDRASGMTGATTVNLGTLNVNIAGGINAGSTTTVNGGTVNSASVLQISVANAVAGPVVVNNAGQVNFAVTNTYTGPLTNFTFNHGTVTLGATDAIGSAALQSLRFGTGAITLLRMTASDAAPDNTPVNAFGGTRVYLGNGTAVHSGDTLNLFPGTVLEIDAALTGTGTINRSLGTLIEVRGTTNLGTQLPPATVGAFNTVRLRGDLTDNLATNFAPLSANAIIELWGGNRPYAATNFTFDNHVFLTNEAVSRDMNDGAGVFNVGANGVTVAGTTGTTFRVIENVVGGTGPFTVGTFLPLNGLIKSGSVRLSNTTATGNNFAGTPITINAGATLSGDAAADGFGGFGVDLAGVIHPTIYNGVLRVADGGTASATSNNVGAVTVAGNADVQVARGGTTTNPTSIVFNDPIARTNRGTLRLNAANNLLGTTERFVFADAADAPQRLSVDPGTGPVTINMVAPWIVGVDDNASGSLTHVDYDPATTTGFSRVSYDTGFASSTPASLRQITASTTNNATVDVAALRTTQSISGTGTINISTGGLIIDSSSGRSISNNINFGAAEGLLHTGGGGGHTISGKISGSNGLTKFGQNSVVLTNASNDFTGTVTINTLAIDIATAGNGALGNAANPVVMNGGILRTGAGTISRAVTLNPGGGAFDTTGAVTTTIDGVIDGPGPLTKAASVADGVTVLAQPNTYAGGTIINGGILQVSADDRLGNAAGPLTINNTATGGTLRLAGSFTTARDTYLLGSATIDTNGNDLNHAGTIRGTGNLVKDGAGALTLSAPTGNGYAGTTTVNAGTLRINTGGMSGSGGGAVTIAAGATLAGTGPIAGQVSAAGGAAVSPGNSPGAMRALNGVTLSPGADLLIELAGTAHGTGYDVLDVGGPISLGVDSAGSGADLVGSLSIVPAATDRFFIVVNDALDAVGGKFSQVDTVTMTSTADNTAYTFDISYTGNFLNDGNTADDPTTGGNDVVLFNATPVPEPAALSLLGLAAAGLLRRGRRRAR